MSTEKEIKKVRDEAAKYRTQLAPYKEAFGHLEPEAITWMLDTIKMIDTDPMESGKRLASVAYSNMGETEFVDWINTVAPNENLVGGEEIEDNEIMSNTNNNGSAESVDITEWATGLEQRLMGAIQTIEQKNQEREANAARQKSFATINETVVGLGYDPESWQGKMLIQVASAETDQKRPLNERLVEADQIVKSRIVQEPVETAPENNLVVTTPEVSTESLEVPATGGQHGGGGIPDINGEDPVSFGDANDALKNLLNSQIGQ